MTGAEPSRGEPLGPGDPSELGDYALISVLGQGGMGRVYLGRSVQGQYVAVKTIVAGRTLDEGYRRRFRAEVERARQVPAFCTAEVLDADVDHDPVYLVVEFVDGPSLADVIAQKGSLGAANLHGIAIGVAAALTAIHDAGVIHRDLKPGNVLLPQGSPKVIDFGIARPVDESESLTGTGQVVGSFPYMSPERFSGSAHATTAAADVFAWGATVTYAGTGRTPFAADSTMGVVGRILNSTPDVTGLAEPLRGLVEQSLDKDPRRRPTAKDLVSALLTAGRAASPHRGQTKAGDPAPNVPHAVISPPTTAGRSTAPPQLPTPAHSFTGRDREWAEIDEALLARDNRPGATAIVVVGGTGGVGKTWLAARWARERLDDFPDGLLYVNLRGFEPGSRPVPPAEALSGFLKVLAVPPEAIPDDLPTQAGLYRSLVTGRRMLVLLDNALNSAQVTPLLPGTPTCAVLITSRHRLGDLVVGHDARPLTLDVLPDAQSREVLARRLGADRLAAEPEAVTALLDHCGGLPLALSIVAARAAAHRDFSLAALAEELRHASSRLDNLDAGGLTVNLRATFASSYQALPPGQANVFRLLGIASGPDATAPAVASLTALPLTQARAHLRELANASLVQEHAPDRFRMHNLVRLYAAECADADETPGNRDNALRRLVDFYLHTAYAGDRLLYPQRPPIHLDPPTAGCTPAPLHDRTAAMEWFDANHSDILAAQDLAVARRWDSRAWQLAWALTIFQWRRGQLQDHRNVWMAGLAAAERLGDVSARAEAHRLVGHAHGQAGQYHAALDHLERALTLSEQLGDEFGQAHSHSLLAWIRDELADTPTALVHAGRALSLAVTLDNPVWRAVALEAVGWYHARLGNFDRARSYCEQALRLQRDHEHPEGEARALQSLGYIAHHTGRNAEAQRFYVDALALREQVGDTYSEATILDRLGETHHDAGNRDETRRAWRNALRMYRAQRRTGPAALLADKLASLDEGADDVR